MRKNYILILLLFAGVYSFSQQNVGIGIANPDPTAILDLTSTTQGLLVPRMAAIQRLAIATPATGLVVYDTDTACAFFYNGAAWKNLCVSTGGGQIDSVYYNGNGTITIIDGTGTGHTTVLSAWLTNGNAGTSAATNFVGTTDAQDLVVKSNNAEVLRATTAGAVGINQPAPNVNAILDIQSSSKGVLFPSLTTTQRDAIVTPIVGLTVYNNTLNVHQFWNGTCWVNVGQTVCSFDYTTALSHPSDCLLRTNFNSVFDTLTITLVSGTPAPVILSASGVPAGVLVNFSTSYVTPTATSVVSFTALPSAAVGTFTITILATSGSNIQTQTYTLTVYDYNLTINPSIDTVNQLGFAPNNLVATTTVTIGNPGACGASGTTAILTIAGLPTGVSAAFGTNTLTVPGSTSLTFTSSDCAPIGTYIITVIAGLGAVQTTVNYTLVVAPSIMNITTSADNINLWQMAGSPSCPVSLTVNIANTVTIGSTTTALAAVSTGNFAGGSLITLDNAGTITGRGGDGGDDSGYGGAFTNCPNVDGHAGGDAIAIGSSGVTINNTGTIGSGGGGGGAGGGLSGGNPCFQDKAGTGGGGGAGTNPGVGGSNGMGGAPCSAGINGTALTGGAGGPAGGCGVSCFLSFGTTYYPGTGGTGGNLGQPGQAGGNAVGFLSIGSTGVCSPGNGGAAGCAIRGNTFSYAVTGTPVIGPTCP